mmetsp:Transcript_96049/g.271889  ORF Transcript_96049/g.271889 Transcript_96049/m.271889 type:complete len:82 (+) Transcript_96049:749-994(+)
MTADAGAGSLTGTPASCMVTPRPAALATGAIDFVDTAAWQALLGGTLAIGTFSGRHARAGDAMLSGATAFWRPRFAKQAIA